MLTIKDINEISFGKAGFSGYKPEDVDKFIDDILDTMKAWTAEKEAAAKKNADLIAQNSELQEKLAVLAEKIDTYRQDEDDLKEAFISAQRMAKGSVKKAQEKAMVIVDDARIQSEKMRAEAQQEADALLKVAKTDAAEAAQFYGKQIEEKKEELQEMQRQVTAFRASLIEMYKKHFEMISHIPSFKVKEIPKEETIDEEEYDEEDIEDAVTEAAAEEPAESTAKDPQPEQQAVPQEETQVVPQEALKEEPTVTAEKKAGMETMEFEREEITRRLREKKRAEKNAVHPLSQKFDYTEDTSAEDFLAETSLTEVGIDTQTYSNIPTRLLKEKQENFDHLEFGDGIDVTHH